MFSVIGSYFLFHFFFVSFFSLLLGFECLHKSYILVASHTMYKLLQKYSYCIHKLPQKNLPPGFSFQSSFLFSFFSFSFQSCFLMFFQFQFSVALLDSNAFLNPTY